MAPPTEPQRLFADWLREQSAGRTHDELSDALAAVALAVKTTGKKGRIVLELTLTPVKGAGGAVQIADQIKTVVPTVDRRAPLWFVGDTGRVTKDDPMQPTFEGLREVPVPASAETTTDKKAARA